MISQIRFDAAEFDDPIPHLVSALNTNRAVFNAALDPLGSEYRLKEIYPYYWECPVTEMPCLMFDDNSDTIDWTYMPMGAIENYKIFLYGFVAESNHQIARELRKRLGIATCRILNQQTLGSFACLPNGSQYQWTDQIIPRIDYGQRQVGESTVRAFHGEINLFRNFNYGENA